MKIKIENIGMLKSAEVKINGLTVVAGVNDTGKSTLGKLLFSTIKADNIRRQQKTRPPKTTMATWLNLVFDGNVTDKGNVVILGDNEQELLKLSIKDKNFVEEYRYNPQNIDTFFDATLIQSPIVFDLIDFFDGVGKLKEMRRMEIGGRFGLDFDFSYPVVLWDLYTKITLQNPFPKSKNFNQISEKIQKIIGGEFRKENKLAFNKYFNSKVIKTEILNTAYGIKSFGLLQLLNNNGYLNKKYLLILDEPEVHLHPEWQIRYADLIVNLVKNGIYVLVNSHSPYMIQAIKHYSKEYGLENKTNFYLTEKEKDGILATVEDKTDDLNSIFYKLSEPLKNLVWK